ncbi:tRNA guanosine-2'-O-methyltransferase TRM11-like protein, related [Eimeria tenella]|uniref:tRNA guanosine-2'-O-methyltransferase TRM11-like protein, related n=1 Tax=Eimeria tenella TaxID=5802 RepID=U6L1E8_EIMTE|nr:tRNA guanosine-2'-O-methyltransferase TRM11-like protein, related [Eimeria tenella]CDJ43018.1 tRNA guanosine-2'-O-methyltransferase TRM11-like protein, related [Eimeria tenella]|eukprot:XP_013233768.1 tRNA guanosine-2'-O-methyltransferase TRM11-like protein, related [Eimeria tenella]
MIVLCWFLHHNEYNGMRIEELEALALMEGVEQNSLWQGCKRPDSAAEEQFAFVCVPSVALCEAIMKRSLLIKAFVEVWASGVTYEAILKEIKENKMDTFRKWICKDRTWAFRVDAFGKCLSSDEQRQRMNFFAPLFEGNEKVNLSHPDTTLVVAEGHVSADCVVFDPFVGTGGLLIAASHYGAFCIGSDIDIRVLKGYGVSYLNPHLDFKEKRTDVFRNFDEYGLRRPEIIRCDNAAWVWRLPYEERADEAPQSSLTSSGEKTVVDGVRAAYLSRNVEGGKPWVDCIMTDPPRLTYIPPTVTYNSRAVLSDLLSLSSRLLVDGGRLVFLMPVELCSASDDIGCLHHSDLDLIATSFQALSGGMGRVLVTMQRRPRKSAGGL